MATLKRIAHPFVSNASLIAFVDDKGDPIPDQIRLRLEFLEDDEELWYAWLRGLSPEDAEKLDRECVAVLQYALDNKER